METRLRRRNIEVPRDESGNIAERDYPKYKSQTRAKFENHLMEFEFRCKRAAAMNYSVAASYDNDVHKREKIAAYLGPISSTIVAVVTLVSKDIFYYIDNLGVHLFLAVMFACLVFFTISEGSSRIIKPFSRRAKEHITAAAAWQRLEQKTISLLTSLDNPTLDVKDYAEGYEKLVDERKEVCVTANVPEDVYEEYNDPEKVIKRIKKRDDMFRKYLRLRENMEAEYIY